MILPDDIEDIIYRVLAGEADPKEQQYLRHLLQQDEALADKYREITRAWYYGKYTGKWEQIDMQRAWQGIAGRTALCRRRRILRIFMAASFILLIGIGVALLHVRPLSQPLLPGTDAIKHGRSCAELTLASGEKVYLGMTTPAVITEGGACIAGDTSLLVYRKNIQLPASADCTLYNELSVPKGGEYRLILSDSTIVYINSDSRLKYPVTFSGRKREVELEGEAYFEVAADTGKPFVVHTAALKVNVLGTGFNVMAYQEERHTEITLVHGCVSVSTEHQTELLTPDHQVVYNRMNGKINVRNVNTRFYVSWKDGVLNFDALPLELLCLKLERWFDVRFFFTDEVLKQLKFSGAFKKYNDIEYILSLIETTTNVQFTVNNRTVTVSKK